METLHILEKKIAQLVKRIKELKAENEMLLAKIDALETSILRGKETLEEERSLTKSAVDELIKNLESLIDSQEQP